MTSVVASVVVVVGGKNFYTWASGEPHFLSFFQKNMYGLDAHVWSRKGGGVTPHSEIMV